tara:strand:- start:1753 stop:2292 length:540 start_codon:yes stop_codon:yes gene_type:complete
MGGYVDGTTCPKCGGNATATGDWRDGDRVDTIECHDFNCGYLRIIENGIEKNSYQTREEIQELREFSGIDMRTDDVEEEITLNIKDMFESPRVSCMTKEKFVESLNEINEYYADRQNDDPNAWFSSQEEFCEYLLKIGWHFFEFDISEDKECEYSSSHGEDTNVFAAIRGVTQDYKECA